MSTQDTTLPPLDERAEFEEWCTTELNYGYDFAKDAKGNYTHDATETAWYAWEARAARAAIAAQAQPSLESIEQYRLQMAGISTAAIGYWKVGDGIHPDYDTLALRDVAKLYAKYDALYKAAQAQQAQKCDEHVPANVRQAYAMAQVLLDVHAELGCKWGDNIYKAISDLKKAQQAQGAPASMVLASEERIKKAALLAKMAADNIVSHSAAGRGMTGWLDDACTYADSASNDLNAMLAAAPQAEPQPEREPLSGEQIDLIRRALLDTAQGPYDFEQVDPIIERILAGIGTKGGDNS